jgi:ubiquinone/menaquinone biosynthesis C-methylase UbiE
MAPLEKKAFYRIRTSLIEKAYGNVLEVGSGTGINFPFYKKVSKVTAIEPDKLMREKSMERVHKATVPIEVLDAKGEDLPFEDNSFDSIVCTLVFCTIPSPEKALQEIRRVCKPDGKVLFFEHVRVQHPILAKLQDGLTPFWKPLCGGCHLNRDTLHLIKKMGFGVKALQESYARIFIAVESINNKLREDLK